MLVNRSRIAGGLLALGTSGALLVPLAAPAQAVEVDLKTRIHPTAAFPNARGETDYESDNEGRKFEIDLAGIRALAGHRVTVRVHGDFVGRMTVNRFGRAHLERHGVVKMHPGNVVRVRTSSERLVTYGTLRRDVGD